MNQTTGILIVNRDEWTLSDRGQGDCLTYATNLLNAFGVGSGNRVFLFEAPAGNNYDQTFYYVRSAARALGATFDSSPNTLPANLNDYKALFICVARKPDIDKLNQYLDNGGNIYVALNGPSGSSDREMWSELLNPRGILLPNTAGGPSGTFAITDDNGLFRGVNRLYFGGGTPISAQADTDAEVAGTMLNGQKNVAIVSDGFACQQWDDGVLQITHRYRKRVVEGTNLVISEGTVTLKNITQRITLKDVFLSLNVQASVADGDWIVSTCSASGHYQNYSQVPVASPSNTLAPQQSSTTLTYYYGVKAVGAVPQWENFNATVEIMPQYKVIYDWNQALHNSVTVQASSTENADAAVTNYPNEIQDPDGIISIQNFQYVPTVSEKQSNGAARVIGGSSTTFGVTLLAPIARASVTVGVLAKDQIQQWETRTCDPKGAIDAFNPWPPSPVILTQREKSTSFRYQYKLIPNMGASTPLNAGSIQLFPVPNIAVNYEDPTLATPDKSTVDVVPPRNT